MLAGGKKQAKRGGGAAISRFSCCKESSYGWLPDRCWQHCANTNSPPVIWLDVLALFLWISGFIFEAGGDWQLSRFKKDPANKGGLMTSGLWRYTRHPNYFGDALVWWGFYLFAAAAGGWWTIFSPLLMTYLLRRVSGVAMLERTLRETKPGYAAYMARTNAFFPGLPKNAIENAQEHNNEELST